MGVIKELRHYAINCKKVIEDDEPEPVDLSGLVPKNWLVNYDELELTTLRASYPDGRTCQGGCTDGEYIYRALISSNSEATTLEKIDINTGEVILSNTSVSYTHANDMTYCSKDGYLYIAHGSENNTKVSKVNRISLELVETFTIGSGIWSIAYNEVDDLWIVGISGGYYFTIYDSNWSLVYRLRPANAPVGYVKQSICCDDNYIYGIYWDSINKGGIINVITWNGMFVKRYRVPVSYEVEFIDKVDNTFIIGAYDGRDDNDIRNNSIYKADFDMYPDVEGNSLRPSDIEGGINHLERLPDGTQVCLFRGNANNGYIPIVSSKIQLTAFRSIKVVAVGTNQFTTDWFRGGLCRISETNLVDAVDSSQLYYREMMLEWDADNSRFKVLNNLTQRQYVDTDGTVKWLKEEISQGNTTQEFLYISQIWGIV